MCIAARPGGIRGLENRTMVQCRCFQHPDNTLGYLIGYPYFGTDIADFLPWVGVREISMRVVDGTAVDVEQCCRAVAISLGMRLAWLIELQR